MFLRHCAIARLRNSTRMAECEVVRLYSIYYWMLQLASHSDHLSFFRRTEKGEKIRMLASKKSDNNITTHTFMARGSRLFFVRGPVQSETEFIFHVVNEHTHKNKTTCYGTLSLPFFLKILVWILFLLFFHWAIFFYFSTFMGEGVQHLNPHLDRLVDSIFKCYFDFWCSYSNY